MRDTSNVPDKLSFADIGIEEHVRYPSTPRSLLLELIAPVDRDPDRLKPGVRGRFQPVYGPRYDYHSEVPFSGDGVPIDSVAVVEREEDGTVRKVPYRAWCRELRLVVICPRCREEVVPLTKSLACPARLEEKRRTAERERRHRRLERTRRAWADRHSDVIVPVFDEPLAGAHELRIMIDESREAAIRAGHEYCYDYEGVHVVGSDRSGFGVWACGFREVPFAGADAWEMGGDEREWPIPEVG